MKSVEIVTVTLGVPKDEDGPMPVTIFDGRQRRVKFQYLSPDQRSRMGADMTARWTAEFIPGWEGVPARWELKDRIEVA